MRLTRAEQVAVRAAERRRRDDAEADLVRDRERERRAAPPRRPRSAGRGLHGVARSSPRRSRFETQSERQSTTHVGAPSTAASARAELERLLDRQPVRGPLGAVRGDARGHLVVERLGGRDEDDRGAGRTARGRPRARLAAAGRRRGGRARLTGATARGDDREPVVDSLDADVRVVVAGDELLGRAPPRAARPRRRGPRRAGASGRRTARPASGRASPRRGSARLGAQRRRASSSACCWWPMSSAVVGSSRSRTAPPARARARGRRAAARRR